MALELDRLTRSDGVYSELLDLTQSASRIDVISGTSAGGLNGALLATAVAFDGRLDGLHGTWLDKGAFTAFFLPTICAAVEAIAGTGPLGPGGPTAPAAEQLRLFMLTTLFAPVGERFVDAFGTPMFEATYRGIFEFTGQVFNRPNFAPKPALAARSRADRALAAGAGACTKRGLSGESSSSWAWSSPPPNRWGAQAGTVLAGA